MNKEIDSKAYIELYEDPPRAVVSVLNLERVFLDARELDEYTVYIWNLTPKQAERIREFLGEGRSG